MLLGAPEARPVLPAPGFAHAGFVLAHATTVP
jgi:hypothetical protein